MIDGSGVGSIHKPTLCPLSHLRKYSDTDSSSSHLDGKDDVKGKNKRYFCGHSQIAEDGHKSIFITDPDSSLVLEFQDALLRSSSEFGTPSLHGAEYVALRPPHTAALTSQQEELSSGVESPMSSTDLDVPPSITRHDSLGGTFFEMELNSIYAVTINFRFLFRRVLR